MEKPKLNENFQKIDYLDNISLMDYQRVGVNWLRWKHRHDINRGTLGKKLSKGIIHPSMLQEH